MSRRNTNNAHAPEVQESTVSQLGDRHGRRQSPRPEPSNTPPSTTPGDVSTALLEILRKISAEVPSTPPLDGRALAAVENFRRISTDLRTLTDGPTSGFSNRPRSV